VVRGVVVVVGAGGVQEVVVGAPAMVVEGVDDAWLLGIGPTTALKDVLVSEVVPEEVVEVAPGVVVVVGAGVVLEVVVGAPAMVGSVEGGVGEVGGDGRGALVGVGVVGRVVEVVVGEGSGVGGGVGAGGGGGEGGWVGA